MSEPKHPRARAGSYRAATPWSAPAATLSLLALLAVSIAVGTGVFALSGASRAGSRQDPLLLALAMLAMQTTVIVAVVWLAGLYGGRRRSVLALPRLPTGPQIARAFAGMLLVLIPLNLAIYGVSPASFKTDLLPFQRLIQSSAGPLYGLVLAVGAPLSEELAFRGFLLSALSQTRLGFAGAAAITTVAWTSLHAGYSAAGMIEVALIGSYFAWLMWRTGNLWLPIICHAVYNGALFVLLRTVDLNAWL